MAAIAGFVGELWHISRDPTYSPELGFTVAAGGLVVFGIVGGAMFYTYGAVSRAMRKEEKIAAYWVPATLGFVYWFLLVSAHSFLRDSLHAPDALWWIESAVICGVFFEIIRFFYRPSKRRPNQPPQTTTGSSAPDRV